MLSPSTKTKPSTTPIVFGASTIVLQSNVTIYIDQYTTLRATSGTQSHESNPNYIGNGTYQDEGHSYFQNAFMTNVSNGKVNKLNNIKILGNGTIDGNGALTTGDPGSTPGDKAIALRECTNIEIGGIVNSGVDFSNDSNKLKTHKTGHFFVLATGCTNINIHDVYVHNSEKTGTRDVFDIMMCNNINVTNIYSEYSSDDVVKFGIDYSLGYVIDSIGATVTNVEADTGCNICMIGSETVGYTKNSVFYGSIKNYSFSNIKSKGTGKSIIGIMSNDGARIDGITVDGVKGDILGSDGTTYYANSTSPILYKINK